ncbi:MAG: rane protein [Candidatus Saccharibacteria bacterium]|nr:rane protein [Candidatus Saccharibacteria bacterium]
MRFIQRLRPLRWRPRTRKVQIALGGLICIGVIVGGVVLWTTHHGQSKPVAKNTRAVVTKPKVSEKPVPPPATSNPAENTKPAPSPPAKTFTYCTATRGVDASYLPELETKLASTYGDSRGWNLGGQVSFVKASGSCDFTVWLTAADQMPSFGAICDSTWSCTVTPNVVLNFDRWQGASSAWTGGGGGLDDYRSMVINHETGHWLGFYHKYCSGAGQPAPVMQQQSIDLQGCTPNSWPLSAERDQLRQHLGL